MAMDMTLFTLEGHVQIKNEIARRMVAHAKVDADTTHERLRIICNKVLKYLMTARGTDAFDASYGGTALHGRNVSRELLPEIRRNLLQDIADCTAYLKSAESEKVNSLVECLDRIVLVSLEYDRTVPTELLVRLHIYTTYGNSAVIEV